MRQFTEPITILNAQAATGTGVTVKVKDYRHIVLSFGTAGNANLTVKFQGSVSDSAPDFSAAQSVSNHWDYVQVIDLQSGSAINGDTGIAPSGTDDFRLFEVNVNGLVHLCATVTARSAGSVTVKAVGFED